MKKKRGNPWALDASTVETAKRAAGSTLLLITILSIAFLAWDALFGLPVMPLMHSNRDKMFSWNMEGMPAYSDKYGEGAYYDYDMSYPYQIPVPPPPAPLTNDPDRKIIKSGALALSVDNVERTAADIRGIAERLGGFVGSSQVHEVSDDIKAGNILIRVPADRFNTAIDDIKKLAVSIDRESINAYDTTDSIAGTERHLQRLRAEEEQYLDMMANAATLQEKLEVTGYLVDVQGQIEALEAQLISSRNQAAMSTISVSLTAEADIEVLGIRWKPLFVIKQASRDMFAEFADYGSTMIHFLFKLPILLIWLVTIFAIASIVWHMLRWLKDRFV